VTLFTPASLALACLFLSACGVPEPAQRDHFYSLEPPIQFGPTPSAPLRATLMVNDLAARGFLGGRQIVYRTQEQPLQVQRYDLFLWEEAPGRAIAGNLANALRAAGLFELVIRPAQRSRADFILGGELTRFEHLPTASPPRVVADFSLTLIRGSDRRSLLSTRYRGEEATGGDTPQDMARAFNRLAGRLTGSAVRDLSALGSRLRAAPRRQ
jgi:cholesterol transport system auxiliary component